MSCDTMKVFSRDLSRNYRNGASILCYRKEVDFFACPQSVLIKLHIQESM